MGIPAVPWPLAGRGSVPALRLCRQPSWSVLQACSPLLDLAFACWSYVHPLLKACGVKHVRWVLPAKVKPTCGVSLGQPSLLTSSGVKQHRNLLMFSWATPRLGENLPGDCPQTQTHSPHPKALPFYLPPKSRGLLGILGISFTEI